MHEQTTDFSNTDPKVCPHSDVDDLPCFPKRPSRIPVSKRDKYLILFTVPFIQTFQTSLYLLDFA
jgi:hypothetical protein